MIEPVQIFLFSDEAIESEVLDCFHFFKVIHGGVFFCFFFLHQRDGVPGNIYVEYKLPEKSRLIMQKKNLPSLVHINSCDYKIEHTQI